MTAARSPEEIRRSVEVTRLELAYSVNDLRAKIGELTNVRKQLVEHRREALVGAAVCGFLVGGGVAAAFALVRRRRR